MVERFAMEPDIALAAYDQVRALWATDGALAREGVETLLRLDVENGALDAVVPYEQAVDTAVLEEARREMRR